MNIISYVKDNLNFPGSLTFYAGRITFVSSKKKHTFVDYMKISAQKVIKTETEMVSLLYEKKRVFVFSMLILV